MKHYSLFTIVLLFIAYNLSAQVYEPYNYKLISYVDNLPQQIIPTLFRDTYYRDLDLLDYKGSMIIDETNKRTVLYARSKKAKEGYLYVNSLILNFISSMDFDLEKIYLSYVYNSAAVESKKDVIRVLRLRKNSVKSSEILFDEERGLISVYICTY